MPPHVRRTPGRGGVVRPPRPSDNLPASRSRHATEKVASREVETVSFDSQDVVTDEELTTLALAADPFEPLAEDAVPLSVRLAQFGPALPSWYMPSTMRSGQGRRWRMPVVIAIVSAFLLIDALGLCNTYGLLTWA